MINNKDTNKGLNSDKNQILAKNKINMIKNLNEINNSSIAKADKTASNYDNSETYEKNKNLNSKNQNIFQNNYNLNQEKGTSANSNSYSGFNKIENGVRGNLNSHNEASVRESDRNSVSGFSDRSGSIRFRKINNNNDNNSSNLNASKQSSISKFDKYSVERLPNLLHRKNNSSADANFLLNKNSEIKNIHYNENNKNNNVNNSISNVSGSKISSSAFNNIPKSAGVNLNNKNLSSSNFNDINLNENGKFMKVSNERLNKDYLKNKFLSEIQRQKIHTNTGTNEPNSAYSSRDNNSDLINSPSKNYTVIPNNRNVSNILQPKLQKFSRNNSAGLIFNNNNDNNNLSNINTNFSYVKNNTNKNAAGFNNSGLSEMFKKRDLSGKTILMNNNINNSSNSKLANFNPTKFKVKTENNLNNHVINNNNNHSASKSPSSNNFNVYPKNALNNTNNNNSNINNPNSNKSVSSIGSNIYLKYPENRFAFIENRIKENLINDCGVGPSGIMLNKATTARSALNSTEKPRKSPNNNSNINNNKNLIIRDQEKEKEDKLFEFFLQYKNLRKNNNKVTNQSETENLNIKNFNNYRYQQSPADDTYLGKLSSLNNSSLSKNNNNNNVNTKREYDANAEPANTPRTNLNPANKIPNNKNLNKEKTNEKIKNVRFENDSDTNFNKINNNNFSKSYRQTNEKRSFISKFINNPNENFSSKDYANLPRIDKSNRKIDDSSVLNDFNKSINSNQNLNKISNTHENFYNHNNITNNNSKFGVNFNRENFYNLTSLDEKELKNLLNNFTERINNLFLKKKFKVFDELITYAYTKDDLMPSGEGHKNGFMQGNFLHDENLNEKDLQIIENNYENENQELMGLGNNSNNVYNNFNNNYQNENFDHDINYHVNNENHNDDYNNIHNSNEEAKFNSLKINILKLNLFGIIRIFAKYKRINFYFFLQKLRIFNDSIKIFNTGDNFLYFDNRFKVYKLDNAVAYRKLQYAVKLILNRRFALKHYFKVWQDLVFNFNINPENKYNSNNNNKYLFTDYYNLPKSNLNKDNNTTHKNNNLDFTNQSLRYQPILSDDVFNSSSQNKLKNNSEYQNSLGANKNRFITQENLNINNLQAIDKILNTYSDSNFDKSNIRLGFHPQNKKSGQARFLTDKELDNEINNQNLKKLNPLKHNKISDFSPNNLNSIPNLNTESKPALNEYTKNQYFAENAEDNIPKDRKGINYTNKLNDFKKINEDSDDLPMSQSDDEGIQNKLVINNFERIKNEAEFSLQEIKLDCNYNNNDYNNKFDSKNSLRTKIFKNFINTIDRKRMEIFKMHVIKAAFFRVFVLKTFGETSLKEIIEKRVRAVKEYLMRKFESLKILDKIFLRRKKEAKTVLISNLGLGPAPGILDSIPLDDNTLSLLYNKNFDFDNFNNDQNNQIIAANFNDNELMGEKRKNNKELFEIFKIYKTYATNLSIQNLLNLVEYLKKKLSKNVKIKFEPEAQEIDFIAELLIKNYIDEARLGLFRGFFNYENAFEYMKIKTLSNLTNKNDKVEKEKRPNVSQAQQINELSGMYVNEDEESDANEKYNKMTTLFLSCDNSEKFKGLLKLNILTYKLHSSNKTLLKHFYKWKYINDYLKMQDILNRKGNQSLRISFVNDRVFYTKKNPKTEIKILRKDLQNIRIYALNCINKATNNILFNNKNLILAKQEFFNRFLLKIKLKNTLKFYGENYKKINSFMGIENYSNRKKNVHLIREAYKRSFQLQKVFLLCEKYNYGFSRYLNFVNNQVLISQNNSSTNLENKSNSIIANKNNNNNNSLLANINNKLYRILNFTSTADANYFSKKKAEAQNACFANLYVNICFSRWKLMVYRKLYCRVESQKNLILFIQKIENIFVQKLNNEGKYFLISNLHIENDRMEYNKENESSNLIKSANNKFNQSDLNSKEKHQAANPPRAGSTGNFNNKKLILVEEKIKIYTKYNRFVFLTKLEFLENLRQRAEMRKLSENKIAKMHNNILYVACNLFNNRTKFLKLEFFEGLKIYAELKSKKLQKQEVLRSIIQLQRLANSRFIGETESLADFAKKYYTQITLRRNTLQKYFSQWKNELRKFLNKIKIEEKYNYEKYHNELSPGVYENNKLFAEKLELIKQKKLKSTKHSNTRSISLHNFSVGTDAAENQILENSTQAVNITNPIKTNQQLNDEFGEKVIHFTNNEFEIFFFKILSEGKEIPKSKLMFFLRNKVNDLQKKNLNYFFKKLRIKLNMYFTYNKLLAAFYSNHNLLPTSIVKDEVYFLGLHNKKFPSLPEQMGNKIRITETAKQPKEIESGVRVASFSQKLSVQRIDYLINQNQSRVILDYEQDEIRLDKEINFCKKLISEKSHLKLARIFLANKIKVFIKCFGKWKNATFHPENDFYSNILENFENVRNENEILVNTLNKAKSDYKKLIQDYKTLKNYFCENCMNDEEEFVLDMKSVKSDTSNNINASDLRADSNYNSENIILKKRKSISRNSNSPNVSLNNKISEMEKNIKNLQNEYTNKKTEYDTIINNFEEKKKELLELKMKLLEAKRNGNQQ